MNRSFKLTTLALLIGSATHANAALYKVVEIKVDENSNSTVYKQIVEQYGENALFEASAVAIQPGNITGTDLGCFAANAACDANTYKAAVETRMSVPGFSYREEVPYAKDSQFYYFDDFDNLESYCLNELGYSTCDVWSSVNWNARQAEIKGNPFAASSGTATAGSFASNSVAFVEGSAPAATEPGVYSYNSVINSLTDQADAIGNQSLVIDSVDPEKQGTKELKSRNQVIAPHSPIDTDTENPLIESRAWKSADGYTVGSVSRAKDNEYTTSVNRTYTSKAAIWDDAGTLTELNWGNGVNTNDEDVLSQGSLRDFVVRDGAVYAVGYNTFNQDGYFMNAAVLKAPTDPLKVEEWVSSRITNTVSRDGDDKLIYSNSRLQKINNNLVAVGEAKRFGGVAQDGAAPNRLFVVDNVEFQDDQNPPSLSGKFFSDFGGIFFRSAGGKIGGLNNYNEIVGTTDAESTREFNGKPRRQSGFIFPYQSAADKEICSNPATKDAEICTRKAIFQGKAWLLDDLTNGDNAPEENNHFRITGATDINDAGVITATAIMCTDSSGKSVGYDSTDHNALCQGGIVDSERVVAVKLIPIEEVTSASIQPRSYDTSSTERKGAGLGIFMLSVLAMLGLRRRY